MSGCIHTPAASSTACTALEPVYVCSGVYSAGSSVQNNLHQQAVVTGPCAISYTQLQLLIVCVNAGCY